MAEPGLSSLGELEGVVRELQAKARTPQGRMALEDVLFDARSAALFLRDCGYAPLADALVRLGYRVRMWVELERPEQEEFSRLHRAVLRFEEEVGEGLRWWCRCAGPLRRVAPRAPP